MINVSELTENEIREMFVEYVSTQPAGKEYEYESISACAVGQAFQIPENRDSTLGWWKIIDATHCRGRAATIRRNYTFGALYKAMLKEPELWGIEE